MASLFNKCQDYSSSVLIIINKIHLIFYDFAIKFYYVCASILRKQVKMHLKI